MKANHGSADTAAHEKSANAENNESHSNCAATDVYQQGVNRGLPRLDLGSKPVSFFEFWPVWVFYTPIIVYWFVLSLRYRSFGLPMLVNPDIFLGGMVGESKTEILEGGGELAQSYILPYVLCDISDDLLLYKRDDSFIAQVDNDLARAETKNIRFPFIVKPEYGCRGAGVQIVHSKSDLLKYLREFPLDRRYIIQRLSPYAAEAGIFYERFPGASQGEISSITLKYRPCVTGDGESTLQALILRNDRTAALRDLYFEKNKDRLAWVPEKGEEVALSFAGSHCRGSIFRDGRSYITEQMREKIDEIMLDFPNFYYGRLDVKFDNIQNLQKGQNFFVIEINGVSSEKTHIWDSRGSLLSAFSTLIEQYGTLFKMGAALRKQGYKPPAVTTLLKTWLIELKSSRRYPKSD